MSDRTPPQPPRRDVIINGPGPHDWLDRYETVALLVLVALPFAVATAWWLARVRCREGGSRRAAWRTSIAEVGLVYGTLPWLWLTLLPATSGRGEYGSLSLVPLRDLATMPNYQIAGNLVVFAAFGLLAPLRFAGLASVLRVLAVAGGCSVLVEAAQWLLQLGRVSSVDDVLLNTLGAGLAAAISRPWWKPGTEDRKWRRRAAASRLDRANPRGWVPRLRRRGLRSQPASRLHDHAA